MNRKGTPATLVALFALLTACCLVGTGARGFEAVGNTDSDHRAAPYKQGEVVVTFDAMPTEVSFDLAGHIKMFTEDGLHRKSG